VDQATFNALYYASKPPAVAALKDIGDDGKRVAAANALAIQGYVIDLQIDGLGDDPFWYMTFRKENGYTWWPSALQPPISELPGLAGFPGVTPYDPLHPPPGSIKVSIDPADYPPFNPPKPVVPPPAETASPVGPLCMGSTTIYAEMPWDHYPDGSVTGQGGVPSDSRGVFVKTLRPWPFGFQGFWTLKSS